MMVRRSRYQPVHKGLNIPDALVDALRDFGLDDEIVALVKNLPFSPATVDKVMGALGDDSVVQGIPTAAVIALISQLRGMRRNKIKELEEEDKGGDSEDNPDYPDDAVPTYLEYSVLYQLGFGRETENMLSKRLVYDVDKYREMKNSVLSFQRKSVLPTSEIGPLVDKLEALEAAVA